MPRLSLQKESSQIFVGGEGKAEPSKKAEHENSEILEKINNMP